MPRSITIRLAGMSDPTSSSRLLALDAMRFLAVCGVVWIHTTEVVGGTVWARWAVPFFTITSVWLLGQSLGRKPDALWSRYAVRRAVRLYGTFLIWVAVYLAARAIKHSVFHRGEALTFDASQFWAGSSEQLWFLPFLCAATIAAFPLCKASQRSQPAAIVIGLGSIGLAIATALVPLSLPRSFSFGDAYFLGTSYTALPPLFAGMAIVASERWVGRAIRSRGAAVFGFVLLVGSQIVLYRFGRQSGVEALAGVGAMLMALWPGSGAVLQTLGALGVYAFGIYIVHVLFVEALQVLLIRVTAPSALEDVVVTIASIALSVLVSHVLQKTPLIPA